MEGYVLMLIFDDKSFEGSKINLNETGSNKKIVYGAYNNSKKPDKEVINYYYEKLDKIYPNGCHSCRATLEKIEDCNDRKLIERTEYHTQKWDNIINSPGEEQKIFLCID